MLAKIIDAPPAADSMPTIRAEAAILELFFHSMTQPAETSAASLRAPPGVDAPVPMLPMSTLKAVVARRLPNDGEAGATKAVYALVAKQALKIDRRTRDPFVYLL